MRELNMTKEVVIFSMAWVIFNSVGWLIDPIVTILFNILFPIIWVVKSEYYTFKKTEYELEQVRDLTREIVATCMREVELRPEVRSMVNNLRSELLDLYTK